MKDLILVFKVRGLSALEATMGSAATDACLERLGDGLKPISGAVLRQTMPTFPSLRPPRGCWYAPFRLPSVSLFDTPETERLAVIEAAAAQLAGDLARDIFGNATATLAGLEAAVLPLPPSEETLQACLDAIFAQRGRDASASDRALVQDVIAQGQLRTFLQPLVSFPDGRIIGFEALTRGPQGSPLERADQLFDTAARCGLRPQLEIACARQAASYVEALPAGAWLSVNVSSAALFDPSVRDFLAKPGIIVEITEHLPLALARDLLPMLAELRAGGARIALDDTGCGYADAEAAEALRPDIVKLCITIIRSVAHSRRALDALGPTIAYLRKLGIQVLAEGVETAREAELLSQFDIELAQGWLYGKARPAGEWGVSRRD